MVTIGYLKETASSAFYYHGLFCASHPWSLLVFIVSLVCFLIYPLYWVPLPGNAPLEHVTPVQNYSVPVSNEEHLGPRWYQGVPVAYIQQVSVRSTVSPWDAGHLTRTDAYRVPLGRVFDVVEKINNFVFQDGAQRLSVSDLCLHVSEIRNQALRGVFPEYGCLILSPANMWALDRSKFDADPNVMSTTYKIYGPSNMEGPPTVREMLFGIPWVETGISLLSIRNRQRAIAYSVTIAFKTYNKKFIEALKLDLEQSYPLGGATNTSTQIVHIHVRDFSEILEHAPLAVTYIVLFFYLYFSVRKIEMVKSKWGLAVSAVAMVIASLLSSVSICTFFGIAPSLNGGEIFPYLVLFVGFENVLVLTKSVVSTPVDLDVKVRVATGLQKEGWSITKNLLVELSILLVGFVTFVPAIQEFCLFAVVGLLTDFFLQMVFFVTVLSIDIRRMELADLQKKSVREGIRLSQSSSPLSGGRASNTHCPVVNHLYSTQTSSNMDYPITPHSVGMDSPRSSEVFFSDEPTYFDPNIMKLPRRLRLLYFWANTRVVQRFIMVCTILWIYIIFHKAGLVDHIAHESASNSSRLGHPPNGASKARPSPSHQLPETRLRKPDVSALYHPRDDHWRKLCYNHWPSLMAYYNLTLDGSYLSLLPSIRLSMLVPPDEAIRWRHPSEQIALEKSQEASSRGYRRPVPDLSALPYPGNTQELVITVLLGLMSCLLLLYSVMLLYRCICSKNYAKWRSSWRKSARRGNRSTYIHRIQESLPSVMRGHLQEIETIISDGSMVVSSCLGGQIRTWDLSTITPIARMSRHLCATPPEVSRKPCLGRNTNDSDKDLYAEYHEQPPYIPLGQNESDKDRTPRLIGLKHRTSQSRSRASSMVSGGPDLFADEPDLTGTIETDFMRMASRKADVTPKIFDFTKKFGDIYDKHATFVKDRTEYASKHQDRGGGDVIDSTEISDDLYVRGKDDPGRVRGQGVGLDDSEDVNTTSTSVWCLACQDNLVLAGCANGRIEIWDGLSGDLKCLYEETKVGVTGLCYVGKRIIAARFDGSLDFLELETYLRRVKLSRSANKGHKGALKSPHDGVVWGEFEIIHCICVLQVQAHQQPINCIQCAGGRVVTASQDHTLKVYRLEDTFCLWTLHGHTASVTSLYLDAVAPLAAVSGSEDGVVRLWDLLTGGCVHRLICHTGPVTSLTSTPSHLISCSLDDCLCIWDRASGRLMHYIQLEPGYCNSISALSSTHLVIGGQGCLMLWDLMKGERLRTIRLGDRDHTVFVRQLVIVNNTTVVCDYGPELKVVHFPMILDKAD